jgi:DNA-binding NarL/FixJ family response regulator
MIRVLTVDDHTVVRSGIVGLLHSEDGILPVGAVGDCESALAAVPRLAPDVVIADYRLTDGDGLLLCRALDRDGSPARVLVFSGFAGGDLALAATVAGAAGVLGKGTAGGLLLAAVRAVAAGKMPRLVLDRDVVRNAGERVDPDDLAILGMRIERASTAEIADVLRLDRAQVEDRVDAIVDVLKPRVDRAVRGLIA